MIWCAKKNTFLLFLIVVFAVVCEAAWKNENFFVDSKLPQRCGRVKNYLPESKFVPWGNWPWLGLMSIDGFGSSHCICILIHPQVAMTGALCVRDSEINFNDVITVAFSLPGLASFQNVTVSHVHYSSSNHNDGKSIALLKLERPLIISSSVQPICLWEENHDYTSQLDLQIGMMIGSNLQNINDLTGLSILQTTVRVVGESQCKQQNKNVFENLFRDHICFSYTKAIDSCHYIGSSAIFPRLDENGVFIFYLRGILTQRIWNCESGKTNGVYDLATIRPWIESHFKSSLLSSCGRRQVQYVALVTHGVEAERGDFPWHVGMYLYSLNKAALSYRCGATLISKSVIVTAGHCVVNNNAVLPADRFVLVLGKFDLNNKEDGALVRRVSKVKLHENYGYTDLQNDIALMRLDSDVTFNEFVQPVCQWDDTDTKKEAVFNLVGRIPGWGINENGKLNPHLNVAAVPIINDLHCLQSHETFYTKYLTDTTICAGYPRGNGTNVCNGDSGGGLVLPITQSDQKPSWYLRGIVSVTIPKANEKVCDPDYYAIYTDAAKYVKWINNGARELT